MKLKNYLGSTLCHGLNSPNSRYDSLLSEKLSEDPLRNTMWETDSWSLVTLLFSSIGMTFLGLKWGISKSSYLSSYSQESLLKPESSLAWVSVPP